MDFSVACVCFALGGYLIGGVPFGFLIGRLRGVDVRTVGSKNIGATNVFRTVGPRWGFLAFGCDFLKGFLPSLGALLWVRWCGAEVAPDGVARAFLPHVPLMTGFACVLGHTLTPYMRFSGGKGVATAFGMLMALLTVPVSIAFAVFVVAVWRTHYISVGSCLAAVAVAALAWAWPVALPPQEVTMPLQIVVSALSVLIVWKHRGNFARLKNGTENKIY